MPLAPIQLRRVTTKAASARSSSAALAEAFQMPGSLAGQHLGLRPRPLDPQHRDHRRLAGGGVLAGGLAGLLRAAFGVQQIIGDLERRAEVAAIGGQHDAAAATARGPGSRRPRR